MLSKPRPLSLPAVQIPDSTLFAKISVDFRRRWNASVYFLIPSSVPDDHFIWLFQDDSDRAEEPRNVAPFSSGFLFRE